jgi:hypothetical protein
LKPFNFLNQFFHAFRYSHFQPGRASPILFKTFVAASRQSAAILNSVNSGLPTRRYEAKNFRLAKINPRNPRNLRIGVGAGCGGAGAGLSNW